MEVHVKESLTRKLVRNRLRWTGHVEIMEKDKESGFSG